MKRQKDELLVLSKSQTDPDDTAAADNGGVDNGDGALEKSLDSALASVEGDLRKAKKGGGKAEPAYEPPEEDEEEDDEPEEEEDDEPVPPPKKIKKSKVDTSPNFETLSKSVQDSVIQKGGEAAESVIDAIPFVKALMDTIEEQIVSLADAVLSVSSQVNSLQKSLSKSQTLEVAQANLLKSFSTQIKAIGDVPQTKKSVVSQSDLVLMRKAQGGEGSEDRTRQPLTKAVALDRLSTLCRDQKISLLDLTKAEERIQKGIPLPPEIEDKIMNVGAGK